MVELSLEERVAVLEAQRAEDLKRLDEIRKTVLAIHDDLTRYKGALGLLALLGSCLAVGVGVLKDWVVAHWK